MINRYKPKIREIKKAKAVTERKYRVEAGGSQLRPGQKEAGTMRIAVTGAQSPSPFLRLLEVPWTQNHPPGPSSKRPWGRACS